MSATGVELIVLSVVVAALLIAGVWYLAVRRGNANRARRVADAHGAPVETPAPETPANQPAGDAEAVPVVAEVAPAAEPAPVLEAAAVRLGGNATTKLDAVREAGELLVGVGAVEPGYVEAMLAREQSVSTFMGNLLAIPHGTYDSRALIRHSAISVVRYGHSIDWNGNHAEFVIGIAGANDDHVRMLSGIAAVFLDPEAVARLQQASTPDDVLDIFAPLNQAE